MFRIAVLISALLAAVPAARGEDEGRPRIFLEKRMIAETSEGKKNFYEVHTISEGETLWEILRTRSPVFPSDYPASLREFRKANPEIADPGELVPGQKILVPAGTGMNAARLVQTGKAVAYRVRSGDTLSRILSARGVGRKDIPRYLESLKETNIAVRDVNRIYAGQTILVPTEKYFEQETVSASAAPTEPAVPPGDFPGEIPGNASSPVPAGSVLSRKAIPSPETEELPAAKPEAQLALPVPPAPESAGVMTGRKEEAASPPLLQPKPPYRGLLSDLARALGETWIDRGTLYLPLPSGGEVVLNLEEYPVVRFSGGVHALIDFRGALTEGISRVITESWRNYRVVAMDGASGAEEMIERLLGASGYHSVKEGLDRPPVIGEEVSVTLPARWVVLRTPRSLLDGEILLIKKVPEKPGGDLAAVLRFAESVGIRVLPYSFDPSVNEGFLAGLPPAPEPGGEHLGGTVPAGGLDALDYSLALLGIPKAEKNRIRIGGGDQAFLLTVQPERMFEAGGKRYVADTGRMSPALRTLVRNAGYRVFPLDGEETGRAILRRVLSAAEFPFEERKEHLLAGGDGQGFEVRASGLFLTSPRWLEERDLKEAVLVEEKVHFATRELLREIGVAIVEW